MKQPCSEKAQGMIRTILPHPPLAKGGWGDLCVKISKLRKSFCSLFTVHCSLPEGFTLIEILISLTLLTIILGAVYSSFFAVNRAIERFSGVSLKYHEARTALDIMRREVEGAFLKKLQTTNKEENPIQTIFIIEDKDIFGENASRLYLTAFSFKGSGINTISYYVQEKNRILTLVKNESPEFIPLTDKSKIETPDKGYTSELIEGIEGFTVETMFNNQWVKTWDSEETGSIPEMVRLSIDFDDNGKKITLKEYAKPKVGKHL